MFPVEGVLDSYKRQELGDPKLYAEADKYQALFYSGSILKDEYIKGGEYSGFNSIARKVIVDYLKK